jgi:hypothetical protein
MDKETTREIEELMTEEKRKKQVLNICNLKIPPAEFDFSNGAFCVINGEVFIAEVQEDGSVLWVKSN